MNMTLDGFCDHQYGVVDDELHQHYTDLLKTSDTILYGRITFELMTYWQMLIEKPSGVAAEDDFAQAAPVPMACSIDNPDCEACQ